MNHPPKSHRLLFSDLGREIGGRDDETIFHAARRGGVRIVGACGGRGTCGSCMVRIAQGHIDGHGTGDPSHHHRWRRACRSKVRSDCVIEIAPRSLAPVARAELAPGQDEPPLATDPKVRGLDVTVAEASQADPASDLDRLAVALDQPLPEVELSALRALPTLLRDNGGRVRIRRDNGRVVGFAPPGREELGLAVDLGTTNVAAFLIHLASGRRLATIGIENPQAAWGADLISRLNHAIQAEGGAGDLRLAVVAGLNTLAFDLCRAVGLASGDIVDAVICGNTAMHHLLAGLPVRQLGRAPFVAAASGAMDVPAAELGLEICPGARVHLVANIGGFVGGDHVGALLATEERWSGRTCLVMDIGTNTEISLVSGGRILSASCPSGPALEGGHVSCGMRAAVGAIERVAARGGRIAVTTIGDAKPVGLCGSGVLDAMAAMLEAGMMDHAGRLAATHPDVGEADGQRFARLAPDVHLTQRDIRAVQLAKAAIRTGTDLLLTRMGIEAARLDAFVIAGAFGSYVDVASGIAIGLFPDLPLERFAQVGNAAGLGARRMLASRSDRARAAEIAAGAQYVELSAIADFQNRFLKNIGLPRPPSQRNAP